MSRIENVMLHYANGFSMREDLSIEEMSLIINARARSPLIRMSWMLNGNELSMDVSKKPGKPYFSISVLPEMDGFICVERELKHDNCFLLDVYGKERMRLSFPWELTSEKDPESKRFPKSFHGIDKGYANPDTGEKGIFGLTAWIQYPNYYTSDYYFELDWRTGKFLWGTKVRI